MSILHQVWSCASGLMSQMLSRRQPIYRPVCTWTWPAVHQRRISHLPVSADDHQPLNARPASLRRCISSRMFSFEAYFVLVFSFKHHRNSMTRLDAGATVHTSLRKSSELIKTRRAGSISVWSEIRAFPVPVTPKYIPFFFFLSCWFVPTSAPLHAKVIKRREFVRFYKTRKVLPRSQERPR